MKKLLIIDAGGNLERAMHEIAQAGDYQIAGVIGAQPAPAGIPHFADLNAVTDDARENSAFFIAGDQRMLNQHRLSAYMEVKRRGWLIVALRSTSASLAAGVRLRENVYIDHAVRVLPRANIGANTWVMQGAEIGTGSKIGSSCWIGAHCRVSERAVVGKNCTLGEGVVIGPDVVLPAWSVIDSHTTLTQSPPTTLFTDPLFRSPVYLFEKG
ncbi:DapH/DapD/GlmU-related protein [Paraburkholderia youngii]|uniref:DapH/DapD/GlmU-related protein n=1 Tax=Paraburkholderia youngii TaxID=2782701 RepID=UPI003D21B788